MYAEISKLKKKNKSLEQDHEEQKTALEKFNIKDVQSKQEIMSLEEQIVNLNNQIGEMHEERQALLQKASQDEGSFNQRMEELSSSNQQLYQKVADYEEKQEELLGNLNELTQDYNNKVKELTYQKNQNRSLGIGANFQNQQRLIQIENALQSKTIELTKVLEDNRALSKEVEF